MNRRGFLTATLAAVSGVGLTTAYFRYINESGLDEIADQSPSPVRTDIERQLLRLYDPDFADVRVMFTDINTYDQAITRLLERGLLKDGQLDRFHIDSLRQTDQVMDYDGWQYLEFELLLFLAAEFLVSEHMAASGETVRFNNFRVHSNTDFKGEALAAVRTSESEDFAALTQCLLVCQSESRCRGITLAKPDHPLPEKRGMCWLTTDNVKAQADSNYIGAVKLY